jgi:hypothetical protein
VVMMNFGTRLKRSHTFTVSTKTATSLCCTLSHVCRGLRVATHLLAACWVLMVGRASGVACLSAQSYWLCQVRPAIRAATARCALVQCVSRLMCVYTSTYGHDQLCFVALVGQHTLKAYGVQVTPCCMMTHHDAIS